MAIIGVHHAQITIPTGAENQARAFYCTLLGLKEIPKPEILAPRGGLWLQVGALQVHLGIEDAPYRGQTRAHIAYQVDDLVVLQQRLKDAGFTAKISVPIPGFDRFEIRDPFGNRVEFITRWCIGD